MIYCHIDILERAFLIVLLFNCEQVFSLYCGFLPQWMEWFEEGVCLSRCDGKLTFLEGLVGVFLQSCVTVVQIREFWRLFDFVALDDGLPVQQLQIKLLHH